MFVLCKNYQVYDGKMTASKKPKHIKLIEKEISLIKISKELVDDKSNERKVCINVGYETSLQSLRYMVSFSLCIKR